MDDKKKIINTRDHQAFAQRRLISIGFFYLLPMILTIAFLFYQFHTSYHKKVCEHLETMVMDHRLNIDTFLKERLGNIRLLAKTFSVEELNDNLLLEKILTALQQSFGPVFVDLGLINEKGIQIAYTGPYKLLNAEYSESTWFSTAMEQEYVISNVFLGLRRTPHFFVAVRGYHNGKYWILRATIDFAAFNNIVENFRAGQTGFAFILNRNGEFQTRPLHNIKPDESPYTDLLKHREKVKVNFIEQKDKGGDKNIYMSAFLKDDNWLLIYQQKEYDLHSDIKKEIKITYGLVALLIITTSIFALTRVRSIAKRMEIGDKEKNMMNEQIVETGKLASVGELAAGIAHEINNPVAIMVEEAGWIEDLLAEEDFKESENLTEFKRALLQIHTQGKRCKVITHKLLSFARKTDSTAQKVDINELITEIINIAAQRAKYSNVDITVDLDNNLPCVLVSLTEMQQVFLNLINNALDAMEKTGGSIKLTSMQENDFVIINIADTGPGIPGANLNRIFDPFFTTKPVGKGTGLGLSICYGIIKKMGGEIIAQSTIGKGTTFKVKIPVKKEK